MDDHKEFLGKPFRAYLMSYQFFTLSPSEWSSLNGPLNLLWSRLTVSLPFIVKFYIWFIWRSLFIIFESFVPLFISINLSHSSLALLNRLTLINCSDVGSHWKVNVVFAFDYGFLFGSTVHLSNSRILSSSEVGTVNPQTQWTICQCLSLDNTPCGSSSTGICFHQRMEYVWCCNPLTSPFLSLILYPLAVSSPWLPCYDITLWDRCQLKRGWIDIVASARRHNKFSWHKEENRT